MRGKLFLLSFLSAALLTAAWPPWGFAPLLFVAFVPLILIQQTISADNRLRARHLFFYAYLAFVAWNAFTTWWIWFASPGGAMMAILANSLLMALTFLLFHKVRRALPERFSSFSLLPVWISFEYFHLDWDLTWPWLTLGNGFADMHSLIQWYDCTGVFGGTAWILLLNVLVADLIMHRNTLLRPVKSKIVYLSALGFLFFIPIAISLFRYYRFDVHADTVKAIDVVVVQPNVDPYRKFGENFQEQLNQILAIAGEKTDSSTDYVVLPETALTEDLWEHAMQHSWSIKRLQEFRANFPRLSIVSGATTGKEYFPGEMPSSTARKYAKANAWYDIFNAAFQVDGRAEIPLYHKSKLVPGVERMPFPKYMKFFEKFAIDMGGSRGSLGIQDERTVFYSPQGTGIAPVICYESVYGEYVGQYIRNGADFIFIITNDGWWGDTPGYKQHLLYGRLRAIETRKSIARSANTGISCFIDQRGDIHQPLGWWIPGAIRQKITSTSGQTFYTRHGDYLGTIMWWLASGLVLWTILKLFKRRFRMKASKK
ncbi:MAG TPA: apolipoprotein N-acyltransferase [Bacteroidia bacterium]|nr:apolipoprotein N-acyltransferase [Bacteroidia bacterium]